MSDFRKVPAASRYGQLGSYWGNIVLPAGEFNTLDTFSFDDEADVVNIVKRVLVNPLDLTKKVYHYERIDRWNAPAAPATEH